MSSSDPIDLLQSVATDLGALLNQWSNEQVAGTVTPSEPKPDSHATNTSIPDLDTINDAVQTLWRLVSIQKSIVQLKAGITQPSASTHVAQPPSAANPALPNSCSNRQSSIVNRQSPQSLSDSVPSVPSVPVVSSLISPKNLAAISAETEALYHEAAAIAATHGLPMPDPDADEALAPRQIPAVQDIGKVIESLRSEMSRICQPRHHIESQPRGPSPP